MRKLVTLTAMAAIALGGAAACTTAPPASTATSTPPATSAAAGDNTVAVCTEATAYSATAAAGVMAKYTEGSQAIAANDLLKAQAAATEGKRLLTEWSTKFKGLSAQNIRPDVKTALDNVSAFVDQTAAATTADPAALQTKFTELSGALTTACSAT